MKWQVAGDILPQRLLTAGLHLPGPVRSAGDPQPCLLAYSPARPGPDSAARFADFTALYLFSNLLILWCFKKFMRNELKHGFIWVPLKLEIPVFLKDMFP